MSPRQRAVLAVAGSVGGMVLLVLFVAGLALLALAGIVWAMTIPLFLLGAGR